MTLPRRHMDRFYFILLPTFFFFIIQWTWSWKWLYKKFSLENRNSANTDHQLSFALVTSVLQDPSLLARHPVAVTWWLGEASDAVVWLDYLFLRWLTESVLVLFSFSKLLSQVGHCLKLVESFCPVGSQQVLNLRCALDFLREAKWRFLLQPPASSESAHFVWVCCPCCFLNKAPERTPNGGQGQKGPEQRPMCDSTESLTLKVHVGTCEWVPPTIFVPFLT